MNSGPSGFHNAPVTKTFVIACTLFTVFFGMQGRSSIVGLSYQNVFRRLHLWRLIAASFAFSSTPELIFALYLLYYFRVFERQIGSNKYLAFVLFSMIITTLFGAVALAQLKDPTLGMLASGPYGLIFSSFIPFYFDIPVTTRFHIFGFRFSDKLFIYLAGLQLLLSSWKRSFLLGICGILAGSLYRLNTFGIRRIKNNYRSVAPLASTLGPAEDSIATLASMGFDRNSARQALTQARNDINAATNILLEAQSH